MRDGMVYRRLLAKASQEIRAIQFILDTELLLPVLADEVSILFKSEAELDGFIRFAEGAGFKHFNSVRDRVVNEALEDEAFHVRFEFLSPPGTDSLWRIEVMAVTSGQLNARLHYQMRNHEMPHVSFKCIDHMHYDHVCAVLASARWPCQASYTNSYGAFSYFGAHAPYLKPRVNLRDRQGTII